MNTTPIPRKQLRAAAFAALLSPLLRTVPRMPVLFAGRDAWLCVLPAAPALMLLAAASERLIRAMGPGEGLAELIRRVLGPLFGRVLLLLWGGWLLLYAGFILRSGAVRLTAAVYQQSRPAPFYLVLLGICLAAALGRLGAILRAGTVLRSVLLFVLGLTLLLVLPDVSWNNLMPLSVSEASGVLRGAFSLLAVGGTGAVFLFLEGCTAKDREGTGRSFPSVAMLLCAAGLLCITSTGVFGPALAARLSYPYFTMIRDISVSGLAQRFEALVVALWVAADFMMCSLLLRCAHEALRGLFRLPSPEGAPALSIRQGRWLLWLEAGAVLLAAGLLAPTPEQYRLWSETLIPGIMASIVLGTVLLLLLVGGLRKKL